jgi:hypothetical protein
MVILRRRSRLRDGEGNGASGTAMIDVAVDETAKLDEIARRIQ